MEFSVPMNNNCNQYNCDSFYNNVEYTCDFKLEWTKNLRNNKTQKLQNEDLDLEPQPQDRQQVFIERVGIKPETRFIANIYNQLNGVINNC